jgi:catechol 2,3-dioxygenase-like lactoylglutathione lyase family enzyme
MPILRLHHAQITIPRGAEDQARQFYCGLLGLPEIEKPNSLKGRGGLWLQVGQQQVHIGTEDGVDRQASKAHLAYQVDNIHAWQHLLEEHDIAILDGIPIPGFDRIEIRDPFGNRIEFIQQLEQ